MLVLVAGLQCPSTMPLYEDIPEPVPVAPACGVAHDVAMDWEGGVVETRFGRAEVSLADGVTGVAVSPEFSVHRGLPDQRGVVVLVQQLHLGEGMARAVDACEDWDRFGVRTQTRNGTLQLSSWGAFELPDRSVRVRAAVLVPRSFGEPPRDHRLYGSVEDPAPEGDWWTTVQPGGDWTAADVQPDPLHLAGVFDASIAEGQAVVDHDFKRKRKRPVYPHHGMEWPPGHENDLPGTHAVVPHRSLTWQEVYEVFTTHAEVVDACYGAFWDRYPEAQGKAPVELAVGADGRVLVVDVWGSWIREPVLVQPAGIHRAQEAFAQCLEPAIAGWTFPTPEDHPVARVTWRAEPACYATGGPCR